MPRGMETQCQEDGTSMGLSIYEEAKAVPPGTHQNKVVCTFYSRREKEEKDKLDYAY